MSKIYIVNHAITGGSYVEFHSTYHKTESEGITSFEDSVNSVGEDPIRVELVCLDTDTMTTTTLHTWEGTNEDLGWEDEDES